MKKVLMIVGLLVIVGALVGGVTVASAKGNGNGAQQRAQLCDQLLSGTIMSVSGDSDDGTIALLPRGESTNVNIDVNSDTRYRVWLAPSEEIGFEDLGYGDWIGVCIDGGIAQSVVLLETPEKPFCLKLEGNVTAVNGNVITGSILGGGTFTIDMTGVGGNYTGAAGQQVVLNIGEKGPPAWGILQGHNMKCLMQGIGLGIRNNECKLGQFGD